MKEYDNIIIDSVNLGYVVFNNPKHIKENKSEFIEIQNKKIYKNFFKNYIEMVEVLKNKFLVDNGTITLLYDNYESRAELNALLKPLSESQNRRKVNKDYKSTRVNQKYEFYNTLDILRYYYLIQTDKYHTAKIPNLEADDIVPKCIDKLQGKILLVSNDSDWCRYMNNDVHTLPDLYSVPLDRIGFIAKYQYEPTEGKIILNKILWGDATDNIDAVFPDFKPEVKKWIVDIFDDIQDFMLNAHKYDMTKNFVQGIKDRESEIKLAFQMLVTIPISDMHFNAVFTTGRNSEVMLKTINKKIYGDDTKFQFGLTIPRLDP